VWPEGQATWLVPWWGLTVAGQRRIPTGFALTPSRDPSDARRTGPSTTLAQGEQPYTRWVTFRRLIRWAAALAMLIVLARLKANAIRGDRWRPFNPTIPHP